jgi:glycosyltransferase involved in cell wall biosynthesis
MQPVSATIITLNEEHNIAGALLSVSWADEIIIVDSGSKDRTLEICRGFTDKVFHRDWSGFVDQKNHAVGKASNDWVLSLDADERISSELREEILRERNSGFRKDGYRIPRRARFMGRWILHGDWYPDCQVRLFDRRKGRWRGGRVHESVSVEGTTGRMRAEIHHYTYRDFSEYLGKLETYSSLAALDYRERGRKAASWMLLAKPLGVFVKAYLVKGGFRDGSAGFAVAVMGAVSVFFKYAKLYEIAKETGQDADSAQASDRHKIF